MKTDKNIEKELHEIAPVLASLNKSQTEAVPAFYFSDLKENVLYKIRQEEVLDELKQFAPTLALLGKGQTQTAPIHFFEEFPDRVWSTIQQQEKLAKKKPQSTLSLWEQVGVWIEKSLFTPQYAVAFATVISAILLSGIYFSNYTGGISNQQLAAAVQNLSKEDVRAYVLEYSDEFEEIQLENEIINATSEDGDIISTEELKAYFEEDIIIDDWII